jgi:hypothetical protein
MGMDITIYKTIDNETDVENKENISAPIGTREFEVIKHIDGYWDSVEYINDKEIEKKHESEIIFIDYENNDENNDTWNFHLKNNKVIKIPDENVPITHVNEYTVTLEPLDYMRIGYSLTEDEDNYFKKGCHPFHNAENTDIPIINKGTDILKYIESILQNESKKEQIQTLINKYTSKDVYVHVSW